MSLAPGRPIAPAAPGRAPVLVWAATDFALPATLEATWLARLPPARRAGLAGWPDAAARHRTLLASHLLWCALQALGFGRQALASLRYPGNAKPVLALPLDFSLSHGGGHVLCAVCTAGPIGVDVEAVGAVDASEFRHYLNGDERAWAGDDPGRFASVWTRKEAVVKAAGGAGLRDLPRVATRSDSPTAMLDGRLWRTPAVPLGRIAVGGIAHLAYPAELGELGCQVTELTPDQLAGRAAPD